MRLKIWEMTMTIGGKKSQLSRPSILLSKVSSSNTDSPRDHPQTPCPTRNPKTKLVLRSEELPSRRLSSETIATIIGIKVVLFRKDGNKETPGRKGYHQQDPPTQGSYEPQSRSLERRQQPPAEEFKPSVRVHNPPGGKSNFQLG